MEIGDIVCVRRWKIYGEDIFMLQRGKVIGVYPCHILVEFNFRNGNSYRESFRPAQLKFEEELAENEYIY